MQKKLTKKGEKLKGHYYSSGMHMREFYQFYIMVDGKNESVVLIKPYFNFLGFRWKKYIGKFAKKLKKYGITKEEVEEAIIKASERAGIKPPQYLRKPKK